MTSNITQAYTVVKTSIIIPFMIKMHKYGTIINLNLKIFSKFDNTVYTKFEKIN